MTHSLSKDFYTTGEVAALCSVTPDTVLKWIQTGKIAASRTPGGHHRIPKDVVIPLLETEHMLPPSGNTDSFQYCWEFYSKAGRIPDGCKTCIVFKSRTSRCYELSKPPNNDGHNAIFCKASCDNCEYYMTVHGQKINVLVVTDQDGIVDELNDDSSRYDINLRITECEYRCSMMIDKFRPDFVILDCSMGELRTGEFARQLYEDPRIPFVKVILVGPKSEIPSECNKMVFAVIKERLSKGILPAIVTGQR
ncbi:MAG: excisionase family DNA-binding protein [candidate division Zixibacteria bacterium]|nr:excisionase family DNA-binding protein [candidate division Zixibacteria bacterium]